MAKSETVGTVDAGHVYSLADLAQVPDGGITSRQLMKKPTGNVTVFAFDKGQGLSEHTAPFDAMVYILDGKAEIRIDGAPRILESGQMIVMPANRPHALQAVEKFKMLLVMIRS